MTSNKSNTSSLDNGISSEDDCGAAQDYDYVQVQVMMECECEQKDKDCAMNLTLNQSQIQAQIPGQSGIMLQVRTNASGLTVVFLNNWPQKQSATTTEATASIEGTERLITGCVGTSSRYGYRHGYGLAHPTISSMYQHTAHVPPSIEEGEDMIFTPNDRDMFDQYHFSDAAGDDTSILIIGGGARYQHAG